STTAMPTWLTGLFVSVRIALSAPVLPRKIQMSPVRADSAASASVIPSAVTPAPLLDRKSTRLNSSHVSISYAVFCSKKKRERRSVSPNKQHREKCRPPPPQRSQGNSAHSYDPERQDRGTTARAHSQSQSP